jgi:hypothetical protein
LRLGCWSKGLFEEEDAVVHLWVCSHCWQVRLFVHHSPRRFLKATYLLCPSRFWQKTRDGVKVTVFEPYKTAITYLRRVPALRQDCKTIDLQVEKRLEQQLDFTYVGLCSKFYCHVSDYSDVKGHISITSGNLWIIGWNKPVLDLESKSTKKSLTTKSDGI